MFLVYLVLCSVQMIAWKDSSLKCVKWDMIKLYSFIYSFKHVTFNMSHM